MPRCRRLPCQRTRATGWMAGCAQAGNSQELEFSLEFGAPKRFLHASTETRRSERVEIEDVRFRGGVAQDDDGRFVNGTRTESGMQYLKGKLKQFSSFLCSGNNRGEGSELAGEPQRRRRQRRPPGTNLILSCSVAFRPWHNLLESKFYGNECPSVCPPPSHRSLMLLENRGGLCGRTSGNWRFT